MVSSENNFDWRIGFGVFCLIYAVCIAYLGFDNLDLVYSGYTRAVKQLQPAQIKKITLHELEDQCRAKLKRRNRRFSSDSTTGVAKGSCQSFPKAVLKEHQIIVTERLQLQKKRFKRKLVVFFLSFGIFFLALPMYFLYLLLSLLIWLFKGIKISR